MHHPYRQIRAVYDDSTITIYQAYSNEIADNALRAQRLVPPFKLNRATWIKPSFLWMMYRSGWGTKTGQERILAIDVSRSGFQWCLKNACLSHFEPAVHGSHAEWQDARKNAPVCVQWDPERSLRLARLDYRSIQIGLTGVAVERYVSEWTLQIRDITPIARKIQALVNAGGDGLADGLRPQECHYPAYAPQLGLES